MFFSSFFSYLYYHYNLSNHRWIDRYIVNESSGFERTVKTKREKEGENLDDHFNCKLHVAL